MACFTLWLLLFALSLSNVFVEAARNVTAIPTGRDYLQARWGRQSLDHPLWSKSSTACAFAERAHSRSGHAFHVADAFAFSRMLRDTPPHGVKEPILVLFYSRRCPWSARLFPTWAKMASAMPVCSVAVEAGQIPALNNNLGVHGFPSIMQYWPGRSESKYRGDRSLEEIKSWAEHMTGVRPNDDEELTDVGRLVDVPDESNGRDIDWVLVMASIVTLAAATNWVSTLKRRRAA